MIQSISNTRPAAPIQAAAVPKPAPKAASKPSGNTEDSVQLSATAKMNATAKSSGDSDHDGH